MEDLEIIFIKIPTADRGVEIEYSTTTPASCASGITLALKLPIVPAREILSMSNDAV